MSTHTHQPRLRRRAVAPHPAATTAADQSATSAGTVATLSQTDGRTKRRRAPIATAAAASGYRIVMACSASYSGE